MPLFVTETRPAVQPPGTGFSAAETGPRKRAHCIGGDQKTETGAKKARQRRADPAGLQKSANGLSGMVGATGIEPVTPSMSRRCSSAELRAR